MSLTVLPNTFAQSSDELIRLFHQAQLEWSRHLGEETRLDFGRWISNPALPESATANCLHDAYLLPDLSAKQLIRDMEKIAETANLPWRLCSLNPSMPADQSQQLTAALTQAGWKPRPLKILHRRQNVAVAHPGNASLTIIPTRASYRHHRQLLEERAIHPEEENKGDRPLFASAKRGLSPLILTAADEEGNHEERGLSPFLFRLVEAELLHLDDSHLDSLLALRGGGAVGGIGVLTSGEVGTLRDWYVMKNHRRQGVGRLLLDRALEICNRAALRHVLIGLPATAEIALGLVGQSGFADIGVWSAFIR